MKTELTSSFSSAADTAKQYPDHADQIIAAAKTSFLQGDEWAYIAGMIAIALGAVLVWFAFPGKEDEDGCSPPTSPRTAPGRRFRAERRRGRE